MVLPGISYGSLFEGCSSFEPGNQELFNVQTDSKHDTKLNYTQKIVSFFNFSNR